MKLPWPTRRIVEHQYSADYIRFYPQYRALGCLWWLEYEEPCHGAAFGLMTVARDTLEDAQAFLKSKEPKPKVPLTPMPEPVPDVVHPYPPLSRAERRAKLIAGLTPVSNPLTQTRDSLFRADGKKGRVDDRSET